MERIATIKDIASELGISTSTVSRILNGKNLRNKELVKLVHDTALRLNYQVNTTARGLRTNKSRLIGIIVPDLSDEFFASVLSEIDHLADDLGYNLLMCQSNDSDQKQLKLVKSLIACNVEGILASVAKVKTNLDFVKTVRNSGKQMVLFDRVLEQEYFPVIRSSDFDATRIAGEYLIGNGCKKFLYIGMSEYLLNDVERLRGYNAALEGHGLTPCDTQFVGSTSKVQERIREIWQVSQYDAIVCYFDGLAIEVSVALKSMGVRIPEEVSICGFDNRGYCQYASPALTSIEQPAASIGRLAMFTLMNLLNGSPIPEVSLNTSLRIREST